MQSFRYLREKIIKSHIFRLSLSTAKYAFVGLLFLISPLGFADDACANSNAFLQHSCEKLQQSSAKAQKERDDTYQKNVAKYEEATRKRIAEEEKPATEAAPASPKMPEWQKALRSETPAKNTNNTPKTKSEKTATASEEATPAITPLPEISATEFATPEAVKLPGGINIIPTQPVKKENKGTIKYY